MCSYTKILRVGKWLAVRKKPIVFLEKYPFFRYVLLVATIFHCKHNAESNGLVKSNFRNITIIRPVEWYWVDRLYQSRPGLARFRFLIPHWFSTQITFINKLLMIPKRGDLTLQLGSTFLIVKTLANSITEFVGTTQTCRRC